MRMMMSKSVAMAVLACVCLLAGVAQATQTAGGLFKPSENVYGYWAKTLGGVGGEGFLDHVLEASNRLQKELETTRQIMQGKQRGIENTEYHFPARLTFRSFF